PARRAAGSEPVGGSGLRGVEAGSPSLLSAAGPAREERGRGVAGGAGWDKAASARRERAGSSVVSLGSVREEGVAGGPAGVRAGGGGGGRGWRRACGGGWGVRGGRGGAGGRAGGGLRGRWCGGRGFGGMGGRADRR